MKKLLYVFQNYRRSYSSASLSILRGLEKLEDLQVNSFEFKPISYSHNVNRVLNRLPMLKSLNFKQQNKSLEKEVKRGGYDYVFVMKGTDLKAKTLKRLKEENRSTTFICFNPDDPFNKASSNQDIVDSIKLYDYYCIWTHLLDEQLKTAGANKILYFPFGVDETIIYPVETDYKYDISFIGNGDAERHDIISKLANELAARNIKINIHIFGSNWPEFGGNVILHGQKNGYELLSSIASTKINLNLLRKQNKNSINMRTFEIPAAGGFMFHESSSEAQEFFVSDKEVIYFKNVEQLVDLCQKYLDDNVARKTIISNCLEKVNRGNLAYHIIIQKSLGFLWK